MGWKTLKQLLLANDHPAAKSHSVNATISRAMTGNRQTAARAIEDLVVAASDTSNGVTELQIKNAITVTDTFTASIPVYSYEDGTIIEKLCEKPGSPNLTHDGDLMYDNLDNRPHRKHNARH